LNVAPKETAPAPKDAASKDHASKPKDSAPKRPAGWVDHEWSLEARDPTPFEDAGNFWRATSQAATIVMCVLMLGVLLYLARALILPLLCAFSVGLTLGPVIKVAERRGVPPWVMAIVLIVVLIAGANLAIVLLAGPITSLIAQASEIGAAFADKLHIFDRPLAALNELQTALGIDTKDKSMSFKL